ncbi:MAG: Gfo/Idh/MocA family oxidoreductase [Burkholderiales bacterium]|nr:Gfo/Idh/MocA family oxidoreductase [Burkholderiales bacterium]
MINLAVVGLGKWGRRHVESATASGRFRVVRAVVRRTESALQYAAARSIDLTTDFSEVISDPRVDALSLITPHALHVAQIRKAAAARKHVLAEKPFALTRADAERAIDACDRAGVVVAVGHDNRFYPAILELKRLVDSGALGAFIHAEANLSHDSMRRDTTQPHGRAASGWRMERAQAPSGALTHLGVHRIDSFVQILGRIERVFVQASRNTLEAPWPDSVCLLARFGNGGTGLLGTSLATPLNSRFQIFGSAGWAEASGPRDLDQYRRASLNRVSTNFSDGRCDTREFEGVDSVKLNFEAFADAIEGRAAFPIPGTQMIHVAAVLEAAARSLQTGQPAKVD